MGSPPVALDREERDQDQPRPEDGHELEHRHQDLTWFGLSWRLTWRAVWRPRLAIDLCRLVWAFKRREWYRRPPFLPLPPPEYIRWRMYTAYGRDDAVPPLDDVVRFARWRRTVMKL